MSLPTLLDFACSHPGCGAGKGIRCTYSGYKLGHPIRQQRVMTVLDRKLRLVKSAKRRAALVAHRSMMAAAMGITLPVELVPAVAPIELAVAA